MASWKRFFHRSALDPRALGLGITVALAGVAMLAQGGCTLDRSGLVAGSGGAPSPTTSTTVTSSSSVSTGGCTAGPGCVTCLNDVDCGPPTNDGCTASTCVASVCTPRNTVGDLAGMQKSNDCKKNVCGADGKPASEDDPLDLPADEGNACTDQACVAGEPTYLPVPVNTVCASGTCDDKGICLNCMKDMDCKTGLTPKCDPTLHTCVACDDNVQNGTETAVDCGGNCKKCIGDTCKMDGDCAGSHCADKICCNTDCASTCMACDLAASVGVCTSVPAGQKDATVCDKLLDACNGAGACKGAAGAKCAIDGDCGSGACLAGLCRTETGGDCMTDLTCASGRCYNAKCADCAVATDCATMVCNAGTCKAPGGAACDVDSDCAGGKCQFNLCLVDNGGVCGAAAVCLSGSCKANQCTPCASGNDCVMNVSCGNGVLGAGACNRPKGAYCTVKEQCYGLSPCTGFPPVCQ